MEIDKFMEELLKRATETEEYKELTKNPEREMTPEDFEKGISIGMKVGSEMATELAEQQKKTVDKSTRRFIRPPIKPFLVVLFEEYNENINLFLNLIKNDNDNVREITPCAKRLYAPASPISSIPYKILF